MNEIKETKKELIKKPTLWGLFTYIAVILALGVITIFARQLAQGIKGPILCIYVAVLPKYILGLALILVGIDGIVYSIRFFKDNPRIPMIASGIQVGFLLIFLLIIFPLAISEGVPKTSTYNMMRGLIGLMLIITTWDFYKEIKNFKKK